MKKKSIIFLCQRVPYPPDRGDRITTWNFVRHLSKKYNIHLFCLTSDVREFAQKRVLDEHCKSVNIYYKSPKRSRLDSLLYLLFTKRPLSNGYYYLRNMKFAIHTTVSQEKIDLIYAYSSNVFSHVNSLKQTKIIHHYADVDSEKWRKMASSGPFFMRPIYLIEFKRLRIWELEREKSGVCSVFAAEQEMKLFRTIGATGQLVSIANGVDTDYFSRPKNIHKENAVIFTGVMNYFPNIQTVLCFYREVYPLLRKRMPDVKFYIVGSNPPKEITRLTKADGSCVVTGYVDDVRLFMARAKLFVAPMKVAQGMQNKILEALSMELPVVTYQDIASPLGIGEAHGVLTVDNPEQMSRAIVHLLQNSELTDELGKAGRNAVIEKYTWEKQLKILDDLVDSYV